MVVDLVVGGGDIVVPFLSEIETFKRIRYIVNCKMLNCCNTVYMIRNIVISYHSINLNELSKTIVMYFIFLR